MTGFLVAPIASSVFVVGLTGLYSQVEWPNTFLTMLAICYPTAVVLGIPAYWFLKAWKRQALQHFFLAGALIAVLPSTLLYAVVVEPVLALITLAGGALGGIVFWFVAVNRSNNPFEPTRGK